MASYYGTDADNNIAGGFDNYYPGDGNDLVTANNLNNEMYGGQGNDVLSGAPFTSSTANPYVIEPTAASGTDYLDGGTGSDALYGGDSNDQLYGGDGDDTGVVSGLVSFRAGLFGGEGNDYLDGGEGNDYLDGGRGNDWMVGGGGVDRFFGGEDNDVAFGGNVGGTFDVSTDVFYLGNGNDIANGEGGNDFVYGEDGNDTLFGDTGNDLLSGGSGVDYIFGNEGTDNLYGGTENDVLYGGVDLDRFIFGESGFNRNEVDVIADFNTGGALDQIWLPRVTQDNLSIYAGSDGYTYIAVPVSGGLHQIAVSSTTPAAVLGQLIFY